MKRCEFIATDVPGEYRCRRCGTLRSSPHAADRIHRWCSVIDLASEAHVSPSARGLGDSVSRFVDAVTFGHGAKLADAAARRLGFEDCGCDRRREWLNRAVPYAQDEALQLSEAETSENSRTLLLRIPHGLGDAVQLTVVLRHLQHYHPEWTVDVAAKEGAHTLFRGLCRWAYVLGSEPEDQAYQIASTLAWSEPDTCYADSPATKAERCLREVFQLQPLDSLCRYQIQTSDCARSRARDYLASIADRQGERFPVVIFHYQGNSAAQQKTLDEELVARLVRRAQQRGLIPVILDWDRRSSLTSLEGVHCPHSEHPLWQGTGTGDGETLAALIDQAMAMLAIDSGPGHVAGATSTPTLVVWSGHHPLQFYCLAPNVRHAVPHDHANKLRGVHSAGLAYFERTYEHRLYADPRRALPEIFEELLNDARRSPDSGPVELISDLDLWIRREHRRADRIIVRDVYLEDCYGVDRLPWQPRSIVDVGAHVGAFACRVRRRLTHDARVICVEADGRNLPALGRNVSHFAQIVPAACCYAPEPVRFRSTIYAGTENTGGGHVDAAGEIVSRTTLEDLIAEYQLPWIDLLKLDCEGCELSLLEHSSALDRVRLIVGEWHDREQFLRLVTQRFADWKLSVLRDGEMGLFWLENPRDPAAT